MTRRQPHPCSTDMQDPRAGRGLSQMRGLLPMYSQEGKMKTRPFHTRNPWKETSSQSVVPRHVRRGPLFRLSSTRVAVPSLLPDGSMCRVCPPAAVAVAKSPPSQSACLQKEQKEMTEKRGCLCSSRNTNRKGCFKCFCLFWFLHFNICLSGISPESLATPCSSGECLYPSPKLSAEFSVGPGACCPVWG